jgi:hypothetical protein
MKKLIVLLALAVAPLFASAQEGNALLLPDGTFYTIHHERSIDHPDSNATSVAYLVLTARRGETIVPETIPATLHGGAHFNPAIAYDAATGMLFAFWIHNPSGRATELMFASRNAEGRWTEAASFGAYSDRRENLRIAVTRKFQDENGETRTGLTVHLAWWEFSLETREKAAKYMMVTLHDGNVVHMEPLDLKQFVSGKAEDERSGGTEAPHDYRVLTQPLLVSSPEQDSMFLIFGDEETRTLNSVRIRPGTKIANHGRLRVPGGKSKSGTFRAPQLTIGENDRFEAVYGSDDNVAIYASSEGKLRYVLLRDGKWTDEYAISLDRQVSESAAVDALRRLVSER